MSADREEMIKVALTNGLSPTMLEVIDDSSRHAGHAGAGDAQQSHFKVNVESAQFEGKNKVECQRMVYTLLEDVFADGLHSLSMKTKTPSM